MVSARYVNNWTKKKELVPCPQPFGQPACHLLIAQSFSSISPVGHHLQGSVASSLCHLHLMSSSDTPPPSLNSPSSHPATYPTHHPCVAHGSAALMTIIGSWLPPPVTTLHPLPSVTDDLVITPPETPHDCTFSSWTWPRSDHGWGGGASEREPRKMDMSDWDRASITRIKGGD
jgi:hypothetical protein